MLFEDSARACIDLWTIFTNLNMFYQAEDLFLSHKPTHTLFRGSKVKKKVFHKVRVRILSDRFRTNVSVLKPTLGFTHKKSASKVVSKYDLITV